MSEAYAEMRVRLYDDERVKAIARTCGVHVDHVCGALLRFWGKAYAEGRRVRQDIAVPGMTAESLEADAGIPGFAAALRTPDWIGVSEDESIVMKRGKKWFEKVKRDRDRHYEKERKRCQRAGKHRLKPPHCVPDESATRRSNHQPEPDHQPDHQPEPKTNTKTSQTSARDLREPPVSSPPLRLAGSDVSGSALLAGGWLGQGAAGTLSEKRTALIRLGIGEPELTTLFADQRVTQAIAMKVLNQQTKRMKRGGAKRLGSPGAWAVSALRGELERAEAINERAVR